MNNVPAELLECRDAILTVEYLARVDVLGPRAAPTDTPYLPRDATIPHLLDRL